MSNEVVAFSGQNGFVVVQDRGTPGVLDEADDVRRLLTDTATVGRYEPARGDTLGERVVWEDADFAEARRSFAQHRQGIAQTYTRFEDMLRSPTKPTRAGYDEMVASMRSLAEQSALSPFLRAEAGFVGSAAQGTLASEYHGGLGRIGPAKAAFALIRDAFRTAPDNPRAAYGYGVATMFINALPNWVIVRQRSRAQKDVGIDLKLEMARSIEALSQQPHDLHCQTVLQLLLTDWQHSRKRLLNEYRDVKKNAPKWQRELAEKEAKLAQWSKDARARTRHPDRGPRLREKIHELQLATQNAAALLHCFERTDASVDTMLPQVVARVEALRAADPEHAVRVDQELAKVREKIDAENS